MTYRDSDALCSPAHVPGHAAPVRFFRKPGTYRAPTRLRRLTRLVLQTFIITLACSTGLGLVVGSVVLVATATAPGHAVPSLSAAPPAGTTGQDTMPYSAVLNQGAPEPSSLSAHGYPATSATPSAYRVLAVFSGHGTQTTPHFDVGASTAWQLRWAYQCAPEAEAGHFMLLRADMAADRATFSTSIEEYAASGHGSAWLKPTGHQHYFVVISACAWHIKVVVQAG